MSTKLPVLFIDVIDLEWETVTKVLGVFIDENVILKTHINTIFTKISKSIGKLYKAKVNVSKKTIKPNLLFICRQLSKLWKFSLGFYPDNQIVHSFLSKRHSIRLPSLKDQLAHSRLLFKEFGALNINELNISNILWLMFKCKSKKFPKAFENLFIIKPTNKYQLKRSCRLLEPLCKSRFSQLCINYRGPHLWNTMVSGQNTDLDQSTTLKFF